MNRLEKREKDLAELGLPDSVTVEVDLRHGLASLHAKEWEGKLYDHTVPDVLVNVNVDVNHSGEIIGLEDLSASIGSVVDRWIEALLLIKRRNDRK